MKKAVFYVLALIMLSSLVFAAEGKPEDTGAPLLTGSENMPEETGTLAGQGQMVGNDRDEHGCIPSAGYSWCEAKQKCLRNWEENCTGEDSGAGSENAEQVRARVEEKLQTRQQELEKEMTGKSEKEQNVLKNQNEVRLAVHALLEMKDDIGGIGPQVSEIAQHFENSVQATIKAEEKIQTRSAFSRFFAGGDKKVAEELETEVNANKAKVEELKQLKNECNCEGETLEMLQEQIQAMEQEQARLGELAQKEKKSKGLFGWLWK